MGMDNLRYNIEDVMLSEYKEVIEQILDSNDMSLKFDQDDINLLSRL